ncbi:MAG: SPOR domain-containing protein [Alphaproteobacteria bacterium]
MDVTFNSDGGCGKSRAGARRWRAVAALMVMVGVLAAAGCAELGPAEQRALQEASRLYESGDIATASSRLDPLIRDFRDAAQIGEAYYIRGLCRAKARRMQAAAGDFKMAVRKSKRDDLTARGRASLGSLAYQKGDWRGALEYFEKALPDLPDTPSKDDLLYAAGVAAQRAGQWKDASRYFREILRKFGSRPVAIQARRMAQWRHPYFAIQLGVYRDSSNAARAVQQWREHRIDAVQENLPRRGEAVWVIMAGRYRTYNEARQGLQRIRNIESGAYIIP